MKNVKEHISKFLLSSLTTEKGNWRPTGDAGIDGCPVPSTCPFLPKTIQRMLGSREHEYNKGNCEKGKQSSGLKVAIKIKLNPLSHTLDSLCPQLRLPEYFTLELWARGFSEKTNHTHNRPYCSLEGAYLRQNKALPSFL